MRYTPEHTERARVNLIEAGGRHAKTHGFASSGMADLAAAAGVTTGSLYKHFKGKSDLFVALISAELKQTADRYASIDPNDEAKVSQSLAGYLSMSHVQHPEAGCPLPSLTPEVARADDEAKMAFEQGVRAIHTNIEALTSDRDTAWAVIAQNVGAVMLARAMQSKSLQRELLNAVRDAGKQLLNDSKSSRTTAP